METDEREAVPPHPGKIGPHHPEKRVPSIYLQIPQPGDDNDDLPDRHLPERFGKPSFFF